MMSNDWETGESIDQETLAVVVVYSIMQGLWGITPPDTEGYS